MQPLPTLLERVAKQLGAPPSYAEPGVSTSILSAAARVYGSKPTDDESDEVTRPTGFDPFAAALFEAVVESAYLVANADGEFDVTERAAFQHVVLAACEGRVAAPQVDALLADLEEQLGEDGLDKRISMVVRLVTRADHAKEVLRVASLLAHVSGGVSEVERSVLDRLAEGFALSPAEVEQALAEAGRAVAD
ncbi:MAG: TerB family tellurite resistance protein [Polyangiaceae bacterium]|nr:TerB family tellurite resistance protein [Polyangiaceae bacterium]